MQTIYSYQPGEDPKRKSRRPPVPLNRSGQPIEPNKKRHVGRSIVIFAASGLVTLGLIVVIFHPSNDVALDSSTSATKAKAVVPEKPKVIVPSVVMTPNETINAIIAAHPNYDIGVGMQDVTTGEHYAYGVKDRFVAASTAKVITAAAYYHQVELGNLTLDTQVGGATAQRQLQQMINQSNNDSWHALIDELGVQNITDYATSMNNDYITLGNKLSAPSMASFLADIYAGKVINKENKAQLLSYMQNTNNETMIPYVTPEDVTVYHKYGALDEQLHDVAILVKGDKAYTLTIYTKANSGGGETPQTAVIRSIAEAAMLQLFNEN